MRSFLNLSLLEEAGSSVVVQWCTTGVWTVVYRWGGGEDRRCLLAQLVSLLDQKQGWHHSPGAHSDHTAATSALTLARGPIRLRHKGLSQPGMSHLRTAHAEVLVITSVRTEIWHVYLHGNHTSSMHSRPWRGRSDYVRGQFSFPMVANKSRGQWRHLSIGV